MSYNKTTMITKKKVLVLDDTDSDEEESGKYDLVARVKDKIKELIVQHNISIYDLAQKSDLTEACIRNWFTKRNYTPSLEAIEKISKAFRIAPFELFMRQGGDFYGYARKQSVYRKIQSPERKTKRSNFSITRLLQQLNHIWRNYLKH